MRALVRIRFRIIPCRRAFPDKVVCSSEDAATDGEPFKEAADNDDGRGDNVSRSFRSFIRSAEGDATPGDTGEDRGSEGVPPGCAYSSLPFAWAAVS